jgi:hypothetical protein
VLSARPVGCRPLSRSDPVLPPAIPACRVVLVVKMCRLMPVYTVMGVWSYWDYTVTIIAAPAWPCSRNRCITHQSQPRCHRPRVRLHGHCLSRVVGFVCTSRKCSWAACPMGEGHLQSICSGSPKQNPAQASPASSAFSTDGTDFAHNSCALRLCRFPLLCRLSPSSWLSCSCPQALPSATLPPSRKVAENTPLLLSTARQGSSGAPNASTSF